MTRLNRRRVDLVLDRIQSNRVLMFGFNAILVTFNGFARVKLYIATRLYQFGIDLGGVSRQRSMDYTIPKNMPPQLIAGKPKVLLVVEESVSQCFIYRVRQKSKMLELAGYDHSWVSWRDIDEARRQIHVHHLVLFYRVPGFVNVLKVIEYAKALNKVVVYDLDDLIFDRDRLAEKFQNVTGQLTSTERIAMLNGASLYQAALRACPAAIASTEVLAEELRRQVAGGVSVLPNGVDPMVESVAAEPRPPKEGRYLDIFYGSGTKTHDQDFELIAPVLAELMADHQQIRLVIVGHLTLPRALDSLASRVCRLPLLDFESYLYVLSLADISIAPLEAGVFADCKSEIKWLEASMVDVPSVVSATKTYEAVIEDRVDGFMARTPAEWQAALTRLIEDPQLRRDVAARARDKALQHYTMAALAPRFAGIVDAAIAAARQAGKLVSKGPEKRRLLFVNTVYPPKAIGGATVVMKNIVDELKRQYADRYEIEVFTYNLEDNDPYRLQEYAWDGVRVTVVSMPAVPNSDWLYRDDQLGSLFARYLQAHRPDLIHFHSIQRLTASVCEAAAAAGVPYVTTVHDAWWLSDYQFLIDDDGVLVPELQRNPLVAAASSADLSKTIARGRFLAQCLGGSERILAVSEYQARLYEKNGFDSVEVNRNGVMPPRLPDERRPDGDKIVLGYLGGISAHKGYELLKRCIERSSLHHVAVKLVDFDLPAGDSRREQWGGVGVEIVPPFAAEDIGEFFASIHVLVAPSIWPESFGLISREAVLAGRWVLAADAGALAEEVEEGVTGHVFPMGDGAACARLLSEIDANYMRYRQVTAPLTAQIQSVAAQVRQLDDIYQAVLAAPGNANLVRSGYSSQ